VRIVLLIEALNDAKLLIDVIYPSKQIRHYDVISPAAPPPIDAVERGVALSARGVAASLQVISMCIVSKSLEKQVNGITLLGEICVASRHSPRGRDIAEWIREHRVIEIVFKVGAPIDHPLTYGRRKCTRS
jgi:hypothetical protein